MDSLPDEFRTAPFLRSDYISFNVQRHPFDDPRVRRALALATDREYLINTLFDGIGAFPATGGLLPPGMPGYSEGIALPYDPARARRLLAEAGYPNGRGFPVIEAYKPRRSKYREILQNQWQENLGIAIRWIDITFEKFLKPQGQQNLHIWTMGTFAAYPDPQEFLSGSILERTGWSHEEYEELIKCASQTIDYAERMKLYRRAELILIEDTPVVPIAYYNFNYFVKPWVRRSPLSPSKAWYWKEIILEPH